MGDTGLMTMGQELVSNSVSDVLAGNNTSLPGVKSEGSSLAQSSQRDKTNPFLVAATPLLTLMTQIRQCDTPPDLPKLHQQVVAEVKIFVEKLKRLGFSETMIDCGCYCLCAALDEAVLATSWGTQSIWVQKSLLSLYKSETWGGERFYAIADTLAREPRRYIFVLELIYILLSLGFEGRFYGAQKILRDEVRTRIFQKIHQSRGKIEKSLSLNWRDERPQIKQKKKKNILRRLFTCSLSVILVATLAYNIVAYQKIKSVFVQVDKVANESAVTAYSQLVDRALFPNHYK